MTDSKKVTRTSRLGWVRLGDMKVSTHAQRDYRESKAKRMAANLDLEAIGFLVVSHRDGHYFVLDGQHRRGALLIFGFSPDDVVQCEVYEGLTEEDEAALFLKRDARTAIRAFDKFRIAVFAGLPDQVAINNAVRNQHLAVAENRQPGSVSCVTALERVYRRSGDVVLGRVLRILRDAWGDGAFESAIIDGLGLVLHRYNGKVDEDWANRALTSRRGGSTGLLNDARKTARSTGATMPNCIAAEIVDTLNRGRKQSQRVASWWK